MTAIAAGSPAPDDPLVARFAAALGRLNAGGGRIGLAVSGGPDSMAMLLLAGRAISGGFEVATVDHGLRREAAGECALVARACAERSIPCAVLKVEVPPGNVQAMARAVRYRALADWAGARDLAAIATAHHADDQAETLLMRLNRGSGLAGLAGVREIATAAGDLHVIPLIRPLLRFRRAELHGVVERAGVAAVADPSNSDDRFDRVRIRKAIAESDWLDPLALSASASFLAEAEETVEFVAALSQAQRVRRWGDEARYRPTADRTLDLRLVGKIIAMIGRPVRGGEVARLIERLQRGESGNLGGVLASVESGEWHFCPEPPRR